jgi:hypothetical protein
MMLPCTPLTSPCGRHTGAVPANALLPTARPWAAWGRTHTVGNAERQKSVLLHCYVEDAHKRTVLTETKNEPATSQAGSWEHDQSKRHYAQRQQDGVAAPAHNSDTRTSGQLLTAVTHSSCIALPPAASWAAALSALQRSIGAAAAAPPVMSAAARSGVMRWEVALPRGGPGAASAGGGGAVAGFSALQWLQGQAGSVTQLHQVYFRGRHNTAPDTAGTSAAEAAAAGTAALAGLGAAWLWRGDPGAGRAGGGALAGAQRFLSASQPRLRVLGGTRCVHLSLCMSQKRLFFSTYYSEPFSIYHPSFFIPLYHPSLPFLSTTPLRAVLLTALPCSIPFACFT